MQKSVPVNADLFIKFHQFPTFHYFYRFHDLHDNAESHMQCFQKLYEFSNY